MRCGIANVLFGRANPCGKLAETFPETLPHNPSHLNFLCEGDRVNIEKVCLWVTGIMMPRR